MKKNYILFLIITLVTIQLKSQEVLFTQPVDGTSGIVSDLISDSGLGTYSADDFVLDDTYVIQSISAPGFRSGGGDIAASMTGLDIYIYSNIGGLPSSNPTAPGTGLLEIVNLSPTSSALTIINNEFTVDVTSVLGYELELTAGTYWLVVAARAPAASRWNWFQSSTGGNAQIFDEGNFGAPFDWTGFLALGLSFDSLAFTISGTPPLSLDEFNLSNVSVYPNPVKDIVNINLPNTINSVEVNMYTITGQLVLSSDKTQIDISKLNAGMYMMQIQSENGSVTKRIIKE